jgi:hypothetical protein
MNKRRSPDFSCLYFDDPGRHVNSEDSAVWQRQLTESGAGF